jgi:hypothetical protein
MSSSSIAVINVITKQVYHTTLKNISLSNMKGKGLSVLNVILKVRLEFL